MSKWVTVYSSPSPLTQKEVGNRLQEAAEQLQRTHINPRRAISVGPCGAKTRAGTPCKQKAVYANGRCKFHGGLSTGPKTLQGRRQSAINGRLGEGPGRTQVQEKTEVVLRTDQLGKGAVSPGDLPGCPLSAR